MQKTEAKIPKMTMITTAIKKILLTEELLFLSLSFLSSKESEGSWTSILSDWIWRPEDFDKCFASNLKFDVCGDVDTRVRYTVFG